MSKDKNTVMEIAYKILLDNENGEMVEYADKENPLRVVLGKDNLIPGFEEELKGRDVGPFSFVIDEENAFGPRYDELVTEVPKTAFTENGKIREDLLFIGNQIPMLDNRKRKVQGTVVQVNVNDVVMDFNHPLAGKRLLINGEILSVDEVDAMELESSGGCGCGSGCGCSSEKEELEYCETCGNPADKMGQGYGNCQCGG